MNVDGSPKLLSLLCTTVPTRVRQSRFPPSPYALLTLLLVGDALDVEARAVFLVEVPAYTGDFWQRADTAGERRDGRRGQSYREPHEMEKGRREESESVGSMSHVAALHALALNNDPLCSTAI